MTTSTKKLETYLVNAIKSFDADPPSSRYQKGYLAALIDIHEALCMTGPERMKSRLLKRASAACRLS
jgi:hypothetical protein